MATRTVLHVTHAPDAGVPRVVGDLTADQVGRGWRVVVASPAGRDAARHAAAAGAEHRAWNAGRAPDPRLVSEVRALAEVVAEVRPDVVHLHSSKAGLAGRLLLRGRRPTVFQPHAWSFLAARGALREASRRWEAAGAAWADAIVCVSREERDAGAGAGIDGRWALVPNGVDLARFRAPAPGEQRAARAALGLPGDGPLAVVVGRLTEQKGQRALLEAWPAVRERVPGATLALVGDGPDRAEIEALRVPGVLLAGTQADVRPWYVAADVVVQPSLWEGMSLALLEALASARSVVASQVEGMGIVTDAGAGVLVAPGDRPALAAAVAERLADPALRTGEGAAARRHVERHHDVRTACARVAGVYDEVLAARSGARNGAAGR